MTVAVLSNRYKILEIPDDLESFFYIVLYYAARYLPSNIPDVASFIEEFFDAYCIKDGVYTAGAVKFESMLPGEESFLISKRNLFGSPPLDALLRTLHIGFRALYKVRRFEARQKVLPLSSEICDKVPPETPKSKVKPRKYDIDDCQDADSSDDEAQAEEEPALNWITDQDRKLAKKIARHDYILSLFMKAMDSEDWRPDGQNTGDRVPDGREGKLDFGPTVNAVNEVDERHLKPPRHAVAEVLSQQSPQRPPPSKKTGSKSSKRRRRRA